MLLVALHKDTNTGVEDQEKGGGAHTLPQACHHLPDRIPTCTARDSPDSHVTPPLLLPT